MDAVSRMICAACDQLPANRSWWLCGSTEVQHPLSGNKRRGHEYTYPLGRWHHQGIPLQGVSSAEMRVRFGPSLKLESKEFHKRFGSDDALIARTDELLGITGPNGRAES